MRKTCTMCTRRSEAVSADGTPNFVEVERGPHAGTYCVTCATALEQSGVELKGYEPTPRKLRRKPQAKKSKARKKR